MADITELLIQSDFSRETDLKDRLRRKLFQGSRSKKIVSFQPIDEEDLTMVNAALGLPEANPFDDPQMH